MTYRFPDPEPIRFAMFETYGRLDGKPGSMAFRVDRVERFQEWGNRPNATEIVLTDGSRFVVAGTVVEVYKVLTGERRK